MIPSTFVANWKTFRIEAKIDERKRGAGRALGTATGFAVLAIVSMPIGFGAAAGILAATGGVPLLIALEQWIAIGQMRRKANKWRALLDEEPVD